MKDPRFNRFLEVLLFSSLLLPFIAHAHKLTNDTTLETYSPTPIRFLLSFDDGPSAAEIDNPTEKILSVLRSNPFQPQIKAIFFAQTQAKRAGGSHYGRALLKRAFDSGHELALHTATPGHSNHRFLSEEELDASLKQGILDLTEIMQKPPRLVRPPFWSYDERTLRYYHTNNLEMLLTDISANDGVIYVFNFSLTKRKNIRKLLLALRPRWQRGELPSVDGATPIIVTFHDINRYTASHMEEYLEILLDVAKELEIPTMDAPFYSDREEIQRAALARVTREFSARQELPGIWNWFWRLF